MQRVNQHILLVENGLLNLYTQVGADVAIRGNEGSSGRRGNTGGDGFSRAGNTQGVNTDSFSNVRRTQGDFGGPVSKIGKLSFVSL